MKYFVSVIISTFNRCHTLKNTLKSLQQQENDGLYEFEILLIDNNSTDKTKEVALEFQASFQGRFAYVLEPSQGKSIAMNTGIVHAKGDLICFTDDDVVVEKNWLQKTVECFDKFDCDVVGGRVLPIFPANTPSWIKKYAVQLSGAVVIYDYGIQSILFREDFYRFIGANFSFKRKIFEELGNFRPDRGPGTPVMGEDTEFMDRLLRHKKKLYYCGEALVWHPFDPKRLSLKRLARWNIEFGRFAAQREFAYKNKIACCFGVPRYLIRGIILNFIRFIFMSWHTPSRFIAWRNFFTKFGMIEEYRKIYLQQKVLHV